MLSYMEKYMIDLSADFSMKSVKSILMTIMLYFNLFMIIQLLSFTLELQTQFNVSLCAILHDYISTDFTMMQQKLVLRTIIIECLFFHILSYEGSYLSNNHNIIFFNTVINYSYIYMVYNKSIEMNTSNKNVSIYIFNFSYVISFYF